MNVCVTARPLRVSGTGAWLPPRIQTADELAPLIGRSARWISQRTGVVERRISELPMAEMAAAAVREALGDGGPPDLVVNASLTPVQLAPDSSVFILRALGLSGVPGFSLHATCLSFLDAIPVVAGLVGSGGYRRVAVVSAERGTRCRDLDEPESAALIGDGAGAVVFEPGAADRSTLLGSATGTWPEGAELAEIPGFGERHPPGAPTTTPAHHRFRMRGPAIYRQARRRIPQVLDALLGALSMSLDDLDLVVPHQASGPGVASLGRLGIPAEKVVQTVAWTGNCIAASVPIALDHAVRSGRLQRGQTVLLLGTGAGLSVTAVVLRW